MGLNIKLAIVILLCGALLINSVAASDGKAYVFDLMVIAKESPEYSNLDVEDNLALPMYDTSLNYLYSAEITSNKGDLLFLRRIVPIQKTVRIAPNMFDEQNNLKPQYNSADLEGIETYPIENKITLPYFENGAYINLYDTNQNKVLSIDVNRLSIRTDIDADVDTDVDAAAKEPEIQKEFDQEVLLYISFFAIAFVLIIGIIFYKKYRKRKTRIINMVNNIVISKQKRYSDYVIISALKRKGATEKEINAAYEKLREKI